MRLNPQIRLQSRPARLPAGFSLGAVSKLQWRAPTVSPCNAVGPPYRLFMVVRAIGGLVDRIRCP